MPSSEARNLEMIKRIEARPAGSPVRFVIAGDSGAWPDPTASALFSQLVDQVANREPQPDFFVNLGDFAGPGTLDRHEDYLRLVEPLEIPNLCVIGNHDLDHEDGPSSFARVHGPMNFDFRCGSARFIALHAEPGTVGGVDVSGADTEEGLQGPRDEDLEFLEQALSRASEEHRVVLMHMPPHMEGHYSPHEEWGFKQRERRFLDILHAHGVRLVCCAHGLAFDHHFYEGIHFVMSGGGGTGLCSHLRGVCSAGEGRPEDRGALFHAVEVIISPEGGVEGRVIQAFDGPDSSRIRFGD